MSNTAIFLDRDNTLIDDPGYISSPNQVRLLDGVASALIELKKLGYKLIVITNQSAVARGMVTEKVLGKIHNRLQELLAQEGAQLDRICYCPYHPDGVIPKYRKLSNNRKPNPGMLLQAADDMDIDLSRSWCIGDAYHDVEAGNRAGCKTILLDSPSRQKSVVIPQVKPDYEAVNMREAMNIIKKNHRLALNKQEHTQIDTVVQPEPETQDTKQTEPSDNPAIAVEEPDSDTEKIQPESISGHNDNSSQENPTGKTDKLLSEILLQLKNTQRNEMFSDFSVMRLLSGIVQILVLFCLLIAFWFLMSPDRSSDSVFISLGFAIVFQLMSLTFYNMQSRK